MQSRKRKELLQLIDAAFEISRGYPQPFGATQLPDGVNFALYCPVAKQVELVLFAHCQTEELVSFALDPDENRTGNVWHILISGIDPGIRYGYRVHRQDNKVPEELVLLDPYARATCGGKTWADPLFVERDGTRHTFRLGQVVDNRFDWEHDKAPRIPLQQSVFYELHVRGFTQHPSSGTKHRGTFIGLTEKIPYLKELGITAVELMPITDFDESYPHRVNPQNGQTLYNFWGYDPISFFAPKASYSSISTNDGPVREFKEMVKAFHKAGIEIILDMVFNHTAEGGSEGPVYNFKGLAPEVYYLRDPQNGTYLNYSGCGNTLNCNHPVVRDLILDSLRYWVTEMHVDGFRFDLASILGRGRNGEVLANPPLIERIAEDPVLAGTKLIAEAWDAAGLYQVGNFPHFKRWLEWNGRFRDDVRQYVRGDAGMVAGMAARLSGSSDLYQDDGREPYHSVNFITAHDGFTLADLVTYNEKYNLANGEQNRDGSDNNLSWNCGVEGPTEDAAINSLRQRQIRNHAAILLLAQGLPMLLAGDEFGRSQQGNNNPYCQDNEISWIDWELAARNRDLLRFFKLLIEFRKSQPALHRTRFEVEQVNGVPEMTWHSCEPYKPNWSEKARCLGLLYQGRPDRDAIYIMMYMGKDKKIFNLPSAGKARMWHVKLNTANPPGDDIYESGQEPAWTQPSIELVAHNVVVLIGR